MSYEQVSIRTHDGECPAYVFTPSGPTGIRRVIFYMDGLGIRPTIFEMGQRLAESRLCRAGARSVLPGRPL